MDLPICARWEQNEVVRGRGESRWGDVVDVPSVCTACDDEGAVYFAGVLYCGRCALERLITALRREVDEPTPVHAFSDHPSRRFDV